MAKIKSNSRTLILFLFILIIVAIRVVAPLSGDFAVIANFSAVGAIALFGGAYFKNHYAAFGFPILTLFISDVLLTTLVYKSGGLLYEGWYWTYIAFALMVLAAKLILKKVTVSSFLAGTLTIVFIHWIVTDLGVWLGSPLYPKTLAGFWTCLAWAIPFEIKLLSSTLAYGAIMFGGFEYLKTKYSALQLQESRL